MLSEMWAFGVICSAHLIIWKVFEQQNEHKKKKNITQAIISNFNFNESFTLYKTSIQGLNIGV